MCAKANHVNVYKRITSAFLGDLLNRKSQSAIPQPHLIIENYNMSLLEQAIILLV